MKEHEYNCNNNEHESGFCCPPELPASVPDTRFFSPNQCQDKIPTKRFSSPNSALPPKELQELIRFIDQVNEILRTLSNPRDPNNLSALRLHFRKLRGMKVKVLFDCNSNTDGIEGLLKDAGRDFLKIEKEERLFYIPYLKLCELQINGNCEMPMEHNKELQDIDPHLRRAITLNFGETVSKDPKLINIFFGIPLYMELQEYIGSMVLVWSSTEEGILGGTLEESTENKIVVKSKDESKEINISDICMVKV